MLLGNKIRSLRDEQGILQRQVAAYLEIDTPMFSKIERGDRRAKRSQVIQMATYFKVEEKKVTTLRYVGQTAFTLMEHGKPTFTSFSLVSCLYYNMLCLYHSALTIIR